MPFLKRNKIKTTHSDKRHNDNYKAVYNTTTWRKLRLFYLQEHPLCEICKEKGKLTPAVEVHHKVEIDRGQTLMEKKTIGYDYNNLQALCKDCHHEHHYNKRHNIK